MHLRKIQMQLSHGNNSITLEDSCALLQISFIGEIIINALKFKGDHRSMPEWTKIE